ncbi:MAG: HEAT repeat domain-containing protein [Myxococcota bacterium]
MSLQDPELLRQHLETLAREEGEHLDVFLVHLQHAHARVREAAIWGLLEREAVRGCAVLVQLAERDPDEAVRAAAVFVLGQVVSEARLMDEAWRLSPEGLLVGQAEALLRRMLRDETTPSLLRRRALEALATFEDPTIESTIDAWSRATDELMRKSAAFAMGRADIDAFARPLLKLLEDPSRLVRIEAVRSVGEQGLRTGVSRLLAVARGDDAELAKEAILSLTEVGGKQAEGALREISRLRDKERAALAKNALAELEEEE